MSDALAARVIAANRYLTLATAGADGAPWVTPVYFAVSEALDEVLWVSSPDSEHSRNIAQRPAVAIVVFDSQVAIGAGEAVYARGEARLVAGDDLEQAIAVFAARSEQHGAGTWGTADVSGDARLRLYAARLHECWTLDATREGPEERIRITPA